MSNPPKWLPEALRYEDFKGDWDKFLEAVYKIFQRDFKHSRLNYGGHPLDYDSTLEDGKETVFWHITSSIDRATKDRVPDLRRCERIPWPRPIIEHPGDEALKVWRNRRTGETRVLLWLDELDYIVVLAEKARVMVLVTAYCTDRKHTRRKLKREWDEYSEKQTPPSRAT